MGQMDGQTEKNGQNFLVKMRSRILKRRMKKNGGKDGLFPAKMVAITYIAVAVRLGYWW